MAILEKTGLKSLRFSILELRKIHIKKAHVEALAGTLLGLEAILLIGFRGAIPFAVQTALWCQIVLTVAGLRSLGLFQLFGPVLFYDLIRIARRNRYFLIRALYASFLGLVLFWVYATFLSQGEM